MYPLSGCEEALLIHVPVGAPVGASWEVGRDIAVSQISNCGLVVNAKCGLHHLTSVIAAYATCGLNLDKIYHGPEWSRSPLTFIVLAVFED